MSYQVDPPPVTTVWDSWRAWLTRSIYPRNANAPFFLEPYTVATLPSAADWEGAQVYVSDESGGAVPAFSDGTNWRRVTDRAIVS